MYLSYCRRNYDGYFEYNLNNPLCDPRDSQGDEKNAISTSTTPGIKCVIGNKCLILQENKTKNPLIISCLLKEILTIPEPDSECYCQTGIEDNEHFLLHCPCFSSHRKILLDQVSSFTVCSELCNFQVIWIPGYVKELTNHNKSNRLFSPAHSKFKPPKF